MGYSKKLCKLHLAIVMYENHPKTVLTPMCSMGQTSEPPGDYAILHTIPACFIYIKSPPLQFTQNEEIYI